MMGRRRPRSFATRLVVGFVAAAIGLMLIIGIASTLFTFQFYARTSNAVIADTARTIQARIAESAARHVPLAVLAPRLTGDLGRPRIHIDLYDGQRRLIRESGPARAPEGVVGAVASLMGLQPARIPVTGTDGIVIITADLNQLVQTLREYWLWMVPTAVCGILLAWLAAIVITRQAISPLNQISAAMRRLAEGDFRPEPVRSTGDDELGELAHAYNGALHQVQSALAHRDRSEAEIRQFIADAGHELRTPLTVIMGYLDVLEDSMPEASSVRRNVIASMRQESRRMRALIEKLIYLARLERGEPAVRQVVDIADVVSRVVDLAVPEPPARISVSTVPDARVVADETDIFEAVRNLIDNALKYAPGSEVTVTATVQGDVVVLAVRDNGPGMSVQDQAHAFDRFYRGRGIDGVDGSGIGLAIVKRATERAGGTVSIDSREGAGAALTMRLPRAMA